MVQHVLFAAGVDLLFVTSHHESLVPVTVWGKGECPILVLGITPEEVAHVAGMPVILSRALSFISKALTTALGTRATGAQMLVWTFSPEPNPAATPTSPDT